MARYALGVNAELTAKHFLVGGDFGPEGELHAHDYRVEVVLEGDELDEHGFLVDIVRVRSELSKLVERFHDSTLNEMPELEGVNPGCEAFARVFAEALGSALDIGNLESVTVRIWESPEAWARYRLEF